MLLLCQYGYKHVGLLYLAVVKKLECVEPWPSDHFRRQTRSTGVILEPRNRNQRWQTFSRMFRIIT